MTPEELVKLKVIGEIGRDPRLRVFINPTGKACFTSATGKKYWVSYGLAAKGSSDLIIIKQEVITQDMVGQTIGRFCAIELKAPGSDNTEKERAKHQQNFIDKVIEMGGLAGRAKSVEEAVEILWPAK